VVVDRSAALDPDEAAIYQLVSLELRALGVDEVLAAMPAAVARYNATRIAATAEDRQVGRLAALAWIDLWRATHQQPAEDG
jgi:hypothetical protein